MILFFVILFSVPTISIIWWVWAHGRLRSSPHALWWQAAVAAFSLTFLLTFVWMFVERIIDLPLRPHSWLMAMLMLWGMIFLPLLGVPSMVAWALWRTGRFVRGRLRGSKRAMREPTNGEQMPADEAFSRRQMIGASLIALPMVATLGTTAFSIPQKRRFRVRDITVPINRLPWSLDGMRIAHVSDTHIGTFTRGETIDRIVDATNRLDADLIALTGDLINHSIEDLPAAMNMVTRFRPRDRIVMIEGNHDLFQGREPFVNGVREHDVPILLDESRTFRINGFPVQLLGIKWHFRSQPIEIHVDEVANRINPDALPILLAHHPHAFDRAAELGIPLTLAGHTHGGQIMLTPEFGGGPAIFKYWSGLYRKGDSSLVVSNGTGNWFPLRVNAPAEIMHITLQRV